jgi:hypothetical protein
VSVPFSGPFFLLLHPRGHLISYRSMPLQTSANSHHPTPLLARPLQKARVAVWLYEQKHTRIEAQIIVRTRALY